MQRYDDDYKEWKPGDRVVWEDDKEGPFTIERMAQGYVWFTNGDMTRETNLLRIKENIDATANH